MADYVCPRCSGNDYFLGKRLKPYGYYGVQEQIVKICKECNEEMSLVVSNRKLTLRDHLEYFFDFQLYAVLLVFGMFILPFIFLYIAEFGPTLDGFRAIRCILDDDYWDYICIKY